MSDFTLEQYNALTAAIAMGATRVKYQDKDVEYRSLDDMIRLKDAMAQTLGLVPAASTGPRRVIAVHSKGF